MKFQLADHAGLNLFTAYDHDYVAVNHRRYHSSLIVLPDQVVEAWPPPDFEGLLDVHFTAILALAPEIVLLGTGSSLRFPHPRLTQMLTLAQIGVEVMDTPAACRTYNILAGEGRKVAAALILSAEC